MYRIVKANEQWAIVFLNGGCTPSYCKLYWSLNEAISDRADMQATFDHMMGVINNG